MTNSHNPQGLISQQCMLQTSSQNALRWMGSVGGSILPFKGMFYTWALATGCVLQRAHFQNSFVNKANLLNHLAYSDTRILKMAGFRVEHGKHRSDDTQDPSHHRAAKSLPEAPFFSILGKSFTLKQTSTHTRQGSRVRVCVSQACSFERTQTVTLFQHEVWGNWFLTHLEHRTASRKYSWEKGKRWDFWLEKTSRKKLTAVAFGGRRVTKTKAQQNYIPRRVAGGQTNVLWWGTGKRRGAMPRVLLDPPKLSSFKYKRGGVKTLGQTEKKHSRFNKTHQRLSWNTVLTSAPLNPAAEARPSATVDTEYQLHAWHLIQPRQKGSPQWPSTLHPKT